MTFEWKKLLCDKRVRELMGGAPSKPDPLDDRTPFERDYGRAVFCTPVRRLQDKTQVFPLEEHDAVRTRLTHSLEVSSVARSMAKSAAKWIKENAKHDDFSQADAEHVETIAATCALIHDLGNPPFGHAGEVAIRSWFSRFGDSPISNTLFECFNDYAGERDQIAYDFLRFEGNAQTIRLVTRLQVLSDEFGLNLTVGTLSAALKYVGPSHKIDRTQQRKKPGFFASENDIVLKVKELAGTGEARNPITYLVEACDDLIYGTGDLEDAVRKKLLSWRFVKSELLRLCDENELVKKLVQDAESLVKYDDKRSHLLNEEAAQAFRTSTISALKSAALEVFKKEYTKIMHGEFDKSLLGDKETPAGKLLEACKEIGANHVYNSQSTLRLELAGKKIIHDLLDTFWSGAKKFSEPTAESFSYEGKAFNLISKNYRQVFGTATNKRIFPLKYCQLQLITDQITGMTDSYAQVLHKRVANG